MNERKRKREPEYIELESEDLGFILEPAQIEVGSGYTVSVDYDEKDEQIVNVKTYGKVDMAKIKREIKRLFPDAKIRRLGRDQSVTIVKKRKLRRST